MLYERRQSLLLSQSNYFQKFLLINFISTCSNWLNKISFTHFLLIKGFGQYSLRKESVIAPFVEWFKTSKSLTREFY